jgi:hypothetical protein
MHRSKVRLIKILNRKNLIPNQRRPDKPSIVWLDRNVTEKMEDEFIPKTLTDLISYKKRFYSVRDFWNYIEQLSPDEKIIFIVNISFGRGFISWINDLVQISAIYVYGIDSNEKEKSMINPDKKVTKKGLSIT